MKKIAFVFTVILALSVLGVCLYIQSLLNMISRAALPKADEELGICLSRVEKKDEELTDKTHQAVTHQTSNKNDDVINIALFGLDRRSTNEVSRSDSIIIATFDRTNKKIKITSLMRDMYVPIPGKKDNRINAAYAFGGPALAIKTININFGLDVRDYAAIDFLGLEKLVDSLGGLELDVKPNEAKSCYVDKPGLQILNGRQVLAYCRIRCVGNADFERTQRQRRVLNELYKKFRSQGITKLYESVASVLPYVETSLSDGEILKLVMNVALFDVEGLEQYRIPVDGTFKSKNIRSMSVLVPDMKENKKKLYEFIYG